jgi:hypothetical protein
MKSGALFKPCQALRFEACQGHRDFYAGSRQAVRQQRHLGGESGVVVGYLAGPPRGSSHDNIVDKGGAEFYNSRALTGRVVAGIFSWHTRAGHWAENWFADGSVDIAASE